MRLFLGAVVLFLGISQAMAERFELGLGVGTTDVIHGMTLKDDSSRGDDYNYWLGYAFDNKWGAELAYDYFDIDKVNSKHSVLSANLVRRFYSESKIHPIVKFGLGGTETKNNADEKTTSFGAKAAAGIEADFKYVSFGVLLNYFFIQKTGDTDTLKETQVWAPALTMTFHNAVGYSEAKVEPVAPVAVVKNDADLDGVSDEDDKCPSTAAGVVVNSIGCSVKEKASLKMNIEFSSGKSDVNADSQTEISKLADFMKKFTDTKVEIAGHTDSVGVADKNTKLSQKRADAVKATLVSLGVSADRVTAKGYGSSQPVADNKTKEGRTSNRRVIAEISVEADKKK